MVKTSIKQNLYYEIKDRVLEEQFDGITVKKHTKKCRVYGSTSSKSKRDKLIELLHQRVKHHRDKFKTRELHSELCTLVVKPNGKIEHQEDAHDDMIFGYLWALYVFYYGEDLVNRFHLMKREIYTDDNYDETSYSLEEEYDEYKNLDRSVFEDDHSEYSNIVESQMKIFNSNNTISYGDFEKRQKEEEEKYKQKLLNTELGRRGYANTYHYDKEYLDNQSDNSFVDISQDINELFYMDDNSLNKKKSIERNGNMFDIYNNMK